MCTTYKHHVTKDVIIWGSVLKYKSVLKTSCLNHYITSSPLGVVEKQLMSSASIINPDFLS